MHLECTPKPFFFVPRDFIKTTHPIDPWWGTVLQHLGFHGFQCSAIPELGQQNEFDTQSLRTKTAPQKMDFSLKLMIQLSHLLVGTFQSDTHCSVRMIQVLKVISYFSFLCSKLDFFLSFEFWRQKLMFSLRLM